MTDKKLQLTLLAAEFHQDLIEDMITAAQQEADYHGVEITRVVKVAGAYEMPLLADQLLADPTTDMLVVLGYIERGETLHGEVMGHVVQKTLVELQLKHQKPMGMAIIGPGATKEQADIRKVATAKGAVKAVLKSYKALKGLEN